MERFKAPSYFKTREAADMFIAHVRRTKENNSPNLSRNSSENRDSWTIRWNQKDHTHSKIDIDQTKRERLPRKDEDAIISLIQTGVESSDIFNTTKEKNGSHYRLQDIYQLQSASRRTNDGGNTLLSLDELTTQQGYTGDYRQDADGDTDRIFAETTEVYCWILQQLTLRIGGLQQTSGILTDVDAAMAAAILKTSPTIKHLLSNNGNNWWSMNGPPILSKEKLDHLLDIWFKSHVVSFPEPMKMMMSVQAFPKSLHNLRGNQ
ncbi:hypothetical protein BLNAU_22203 [Blattamonas nauphoetae]|uniref:Uncharacterized protein n=1 Tax=Blattamonas nauphoetae TaxID=2049346 RepID=A0ABQ9WTP8_9EUKA|nr:hypothetical protein BLNAU_22203 [Blattamonas nauphoetae]